MFVKVSKSNDDLTLTFVDQIQHTRQDTTLTLGGCGVKTQLHQHCLQL